MEAETRLSPTKLGLKAMQGVSRTVAESNSSFKRIPLAALLIAVCKIRNPESRCGETAKFQARGNVAWNGLTARKQ